LWNKILYNIELTQEKNNIVVIKKIRPRSEPNNDSKITLKLSEDRNVILECDEQVNKVMKTLGKDVVPTEWKYVSN